MKSSLYGILIRMERKFTTEQGSREWESLNPMQNDKVSMFGTSHQRQKNHRRGLRPSLAEMMRLEPRRQH
jgi:hypothetical protein